MKLSEIKLDEVLSGKNWLLATDGEDGGNPEVNDAIGFSSSDTGLLAAVVKFADGSEHASLVVKSFPHGGDDIDIYVHSKFGWINIHTPGFMRAVGKYSHDIFPFDYYLASPWKGGGQQQPEMDKASPHAKLFREAAVRIKGAQKG